MLVRRKTMERMLLDQAWAAGVFEGEGTIYAHKSRSRSGRVGVYGAITVEMTNEEVVRRLQEVTGEGVVRRALTRGLGKKPKWSWRVSDRAGIEEVLDMFGPYLSLQRKEQVARVRAQLTPVMRRSHRRAA